ncbi:EamA family transporter RarD [Candidatus Puniceispirillum sp.]|uniref:EamA family transporter RarD n=1 Tax=Candidatus Puniceispirillum sp. TaxID=2026719 RepID=UPI001EC41954|nr:EamA family transporter RarD [Candidatus Puniceispirillum sp.]
MASEHPDAVGTMSTTAPKPHNAQTRGIIFAIFAGFLWGVLPIYINSVDSATPYEIVAHRAIWSGVFLALLMPFLGGFGQIITMLRQRNLQIGLGTTTLLVGINWSVFIYAVQSGQMVQAALGYFIYPLVALLLGVLILGERLDRMGWFAIALVACGVMTKSIFAGEPPVLSLFLAGTFGLYAVIHKKLGVNPVNGLFVESVILLPFGIAYLLWLVHQGTPIFFGGGAINIMLAVMAGILTILPLLFFHAGNRALTMTMASLLFYFNPTTQLTIGVFIYDAPFIVADATTFGLIWVGIIVYFSSRPRTVRPVA